MNNTPDTNISEPPGEILNGNQKKKSFFSRIRSFFTKPAPSLKESLEEVIEEHNANGGEAIDKEEKALLHNVLSFRNVEVEDIMVPRADIVSVNHDITLKDLQKVIVTNAHTRLPVCRKSLDDIIGFIHLKDLVSVLSDGQPFDIKKIIRQILFVPPSMKGSNLLMKMQVSHVHMAIVVDEYGGTSGLATLEDLVEEIVGEIEDEHDVVNNDAFKKIDKNTYEVSARMDIEELEQKLKTDLTSSFDEDDDFDTVGGLIFFILGRVPVVGEIAKHEKSGVEFEIKEADTRHIKRVIVRKP